MKNNAPFLLVLVTLVLGALSPAESPPPLEESYFGLNGTKMYQIPDQIETKVQERLGYMKELDVRWDRVDMFWHMIERQPGEWDFSWPDRVVDEFEEHGIQWYPILDYGAAWWEGHNAPYEDQHFEEFAQYVSKVVERYQGRLDIWSVWNEPNIANFWTPEPRAEDYFRLLKMTAEAAREANPDVQLGAPVLAPLGSWDRKFTERLYQLGAKEYFDIFDYHYYRQYPPESEVPDEIEEIRAVMTRYGDDKPIWISESGVSSPMPGAPGTYESQAAWVVRNHLLSLGMGVERFFYFDLQNWWDNKPDEWDSQLGLVEAGGGKKLAYHAYRTLVDMVDYREIVGRITDLGEDVEAVLVRDPGTGEYTLAIWLAAENEETATHETAIELAESEALLVHPYGEREKVAGESFTLTIDRHPRYIQRVNPQRYLPLAGVCLDPGMIIMSTTETWPLAIRISPLLENPEVKVTSVQSPRNLVFDGTKGEVRCEGEMPQGVYTIAATLEVTHGPPANRQTVEIERTARVEIIQSMAFDFRPYETETGLEGQLTLSNQSGRQLEATPSIVEIRGESQTVIAESEQSVSLAKDATERVELALPDEQLAGLSEVISWQAKFGAFSSKPFRIAPVVLANDAPAIDGKLADWGDQPALFIGREENITRNAGAVWTPRDASARVRFRLAPETLYVAAEVTDDSPAVNPHEPAAMWRGDALELYVGLGGPTRRTVLDKEVEYQIGVAPVTESGKPVVFWFHEDVPLEDAEIAVELIETGYVVEAAIPLAKLNRRAIKFEPGMLIGLDVALDDLDEGDVAPAGNIPGRAVVWNGTPMNWIDPSGWGMGVLVEE